MSSVLDLLQDCTLHIRRGDSAGTGFFIAPGLVITCAHVVEGGNGEAIRLDWKGERDLAVKAVHPAPAQGAEEPPDLVLLEIEETDHPCVLLHGGVGPGDRLQGFGYPGSSGRGDPVTADFEGFTENPRFLKFKQAQIQPGHSGGPILNLRTGAVCGLISWTRGALNLPGRLRPFILDIGGLGVTAETILTCYPGLVLRNARFHVKEEGWLLCLSREQRRGFELAMPRSPAVRAATASLCSPVPVSVLLQPGARRELYGSWEPMGPSWAFTFSLAPDPLHPGIVYVALGDGQGIFRSEDGGLSWTPGSLGLTNRNVVSIAVSRHDGTVFAGTRDGLWISRDGGETWTRGAERYRGKEVISVTLSPHDPGFLLVGTLKPGGMSFGAGTVAALSEGPKIRASDSVGAGHLHITKDAGQTWITFPTETVNGACVASDDSRIVYVASADGGLFRTLDGFETIERVESFPGQEPLCVTLAPDDSGTVLVGTLRSGLYRSFDAGNTWDKVDAVGDVQVSQITFDSGGHGLAATRAGVFESPDGGRLWRVANDGLAYTWILSVAATADGALLAGASGGGVYRRARAQRNWAAHNDGFPPAVGLILSVGDPWHLFAGTPVGLFRSRDAGATWTFAAFPGQRVTALALPGPWKKESPGGGGLHVSFDGGRSVQDSPMAGPPSLRIYAGTLSGNLFRSLDAGKTWEERIARENDDAPPRKRIRDLSVRAGEPEILYAVFENGGLWRSTDGGRAWSRINLEAPEEWVISFFLSPHGERPVLYAGTNRGIHISEDGGSSWRMASGLGGAFLTKIAAPSRVPGLAFAVDLSRAVYRSQDRGLSWELMRAGDQDPEDKRRRWATLAVSPDGTKIALGSSSGAFLSRDGGETWEALDGGILGTDDYVNHLFFDLEGTLYAATAGGIFRMRLS